MLDDFASARAERDKAAHFPYVASDFVLITVVDHELDAVSVSELEMSSRFQIINAPANLGTIALVYRARWSRVTVAPSSWTVCVCRACMVVVRAAHANAKIPVVLGGIGVGGDGDQGGGFCLI